MKTLLFYLEKMVFPSRPTMARLAGFILAALIPQLAMSQNSPHKVRTEKIRALQAMYGEWVLNSRMIPLGRPEVAESGTMSCRSIYDSTYVECDVSLRSNGRSRGYRQFITYNPDSSKYELLYLYTGTPMRVLEFGKMTDAGLVTNAKLRLAGGRTENIDGILKIINNDELYYESRSSETKGEVDYTCRYVRKK